MSISVGPKQPLPGSAPASSSQDAKNETSGAKLDPLAAPPSAPVGAGSAVAKASGTYTVVSGDTTSGIAGRFGSSVDAITKANSLPNANVINIGQKLAIPGRAIAHLSTSATIAQVAAQFGANADELAVANHLDAKATLPAGKQLWLSGATEYKAKSTDTLATLAKRFNTTAQAIATANGLDPKAALKAGKTLIFYPGHAVPTPGPTPAPKPKPNIPEPKVMKNNAGTKYTLDKAGKLFIDGPSSDDVEQGVAGDCYFLSAIASLAQQHPDAIRKMIKKNGDGTYTVTFQQGSWGEDKTKGAWVQSFKPVHVKIDGKLPGKVGEALYAEEGRSGHELWAPLLEKAYAKWKGGYEQIGNGGWSADALSELTGKVATTLPLAKAKPEKVYSELSAALAKGGTICAGTKSHSVEVMKNGIVANHEYSVLGVSSAGGKQFVKLRNPWGNQEFGKDGKDDGYFTMPMADFLRQFSDVDMVA